MGEIDSTVIAAAIGAFSAVIVEALRVHRDRSRREQGKRRTRKEDRVKRH